jgi:hypothetical protein
LPDEVRHLIGRGLRAFASAVEERRVNLAVRHTQECGDHDRHER